MSDILIKNMEMPNGCYDCPLRKHEERSYYYECNASDGVNLNWFTIPAYCPIVDVPPHGDLKDADKMFSVLERACCTDSLADTIARDILKGLIKNAPTVIEASKERE